MFRSAPNLFHGDIEDNLDHFIINYVEKFKLPRLSRSDLKPIEESEGDGCLSSGASGSVHRYWLEVPLELEELGYHENDQEVVEKKHSKPVVMPVSVEVVVKKIFFQGLSPELAISRFLNEVEILDHFICRVTPDAKKFSNPYYAVDPNIISCYGYCYDCTQDDGDDESYQKNHFWIVLEYAQKGSLSPEIIKELTNFERVHVSLSICEGLHTLHGNNIVHVDLKPPNILVDKNGFIKLTDFGCSVVAHETFFLFYKSDYDALKRTNYVDKYMPAIVRISEREFKILFKSTSFLSEKDGSRDLSHVEKKQSFLIEIECPENFLDIVNKFFVGNDRFCVIPLCSPLIHFLEENGYSHSYLETVLRDENGTALWMAPEFYAGIYHSDSSHVYKRPDVRTDVYSLGITLVEVWTGEEPYVEHDGCGNIFPILRKIVSEGLRPKIHRTYSENGLVEANTLEAGDRAGKVQTFIKDCWDCDPCKRPKVTVLIDFFRAWIDDILVESVARNNIYQLKEILEKLQDPHWLLAEKNFKDHPARKSQKISLLQYVFWALSPIPILEIVFAYVPRYQIKSQADALLRSPWVKENDKDSECIIKKILECYEVFQKLKTDDIEPIRKQWGQIGFEQRKLPQYLFELYRRKQGANCEDVSGSMHLRNDEDLWYRKPEVKMGKKTFTISYDACYCNAKKIHRKEISGLVKSFAFEGLHVEHEKRIFRDLLDELTIVKKYIQRKPLSP